MIRPILITLTLMGGTLSAQLPAPPHEPMRDGRPCQEQPPHPGPGSIFRGLGLSPGQEKAVHAAMDKHCPNERARRKALDDQEDVLHAALEEPSTQEPQLQALRQAVVEASLQFDLEHRALALELNAILTPEQQQGLIRSAEHYIENAQRFRTGLHKIA